MIQEIYDYRVEESIDAAIIIVLVHQEVVYLTGPSGIHLSKSKGGWQCSWTIIKD